MSVTNRMVVAALALAGVFVSTYLLLHKVGVVGTLICGVEGGCDVVQSSRYAFVLGIPVAAYGVAGYLAIFGVALAGTRPGLAARPGLALALVALTGGAFLFSVYLSAMSGLVIGAWCRWCLVSATLATFSFAFSTPELARFRRRPAGDPTGSYRSAASRIRVQSSSD
jgi:uncharacterized membrane protein